MPRSPGVCAGMPTCFLCPTKARTVTYRIVLQQDVWLLLIDKKEAIRHWVGPIYDLVYMDNDATTRGADHRNQRPDATRGGAGHGGVDPPVRLRG